MRSGGRSRWDQAGDCALVDGDATLGDLSRHDSVEQHQQLEVTAHVRQEELEAPSAKPRIALTLAALAAVRAALVVARARGGGGEGARDRILAH